MSSLLTWHFYWIGCTPDYTSLSLSFHSLSLCHHVVVFYVILGLNPCKQINKEIGQISEPISIYNKQENGERSGVCYNINEVNDLEESFVPFLQSLCSIDLNLFHFPFFSSPLRSSNCNPSLLDEVSLHAIFLVLISSYSYSGWSSVGLFSEHVSRTGLLLSL